MLRPFASASNLGVAIIFHGSVVGCAKLSHLVGVLWPSTRAKREGLLPDAAAALPTTELTFAPLKYMSFFSPATFGILANYAAAVEGTESGQGS